MGQPSRLVPSATKELWDCRSCLEIKWIPSSAYIQVPGSGLRLRSSVLRDELRHSDSMRTVMLHYAHAFFSQITQSAACAHFHSLDQRCCRWLLMTHDRVQTDQFLLTQEFLGMWLGVRGGGVPARA